MGPCCISVYAGEFYLEYQLVPGPGPLLCIDDYYARVQ